MTESTTKDLGIIYLLENEAFEAPVIKIGRTGRTGTDLSNRIRTLNTGVPLPFTCSHASLVEAPVEVEKLLHKVFHPAKRQWRGEFYEVDSWRVLLVLNQYELEDMTNFAPVVSSEDLESIETTVMERDRHARATFAVLEIPIGETLTLANNPEVTCVVANDKTAVLYEEETYALSTLTTKLKESTHGLQGIRYWEYQGQTLLKRRDQILERDA